MSDLAIRLGTDDVVSAGWDGVNRCKVRVWHAPSWTEVRTFEKDRVPGR